MEKITLKPSYKEILFKGNEPEVCFDVLSYSGNNNQERNLGSIFVLSHLHQKGSDLSYLVSLVSSLAKREFYSPRSTMDQDPKTAFERTLKKLNEVLDDFFKNNDFILNLGLAVISGENIFISRLGKFKVALARNSEYIDILNNVDLFNKNDGKEEKFSNIISGKLRPNDKIFAYFPLRCVTSREKLLNPIFISKDQGEFYAKLSSVAGNADNFSCCGVYINMQQIKEIPVEMDNDANIAKYGGALYTTAHTPEVIPANTPEQSSAILATNEKHNPINSDGAGDLKVITNESKPVPKVIQRPNVIQSEVSVARRSSMVGSTISKIGKFVAFGKSARRTLNFNELKRRRLINFVIATVLVISSIGAWTFIKNRNSPSTSALFNQSTESLKLARSSLDQNDTRQARNILLSALAQISSTSDKKIDTVKADITETLNIIDKISDKQPELYADFTSKNIGISKISVYDDKVYLVDKTGKIYLATSNEVAELGKFSSIPGFIVVNSQLLVGYNGTDKLEILGLKTNKLNSPITFQTQFTGHDINLYEGNLYLISENTIYKYADIAAGETKLINWGAVEGSEPLSLTVDGDIYILTRDGKLTKYFKGKKESDYTLQVEPSANSKIFTSKDSFFIYLTDLPKSRIFVFDKNSGSLKTSYKLDPVHDIIDTYISPDGGAWIATKDSIWQIKP